MTSIPLPLELCELISQRAAQRAREGIRRRNWSARAQASIHPAARPGVVAIKTDLYYLKFQERGIKPFLMTSLEGKVVPIRGQLFYVSGVGLPGMGYQDRKNKTRYPHTGPIWRAQRWRHPGIDPERFMENAIRQARFETKPEVRRRLIQALKGEA